MSDQEESSSSSLSSLPFLSEFFGHVDRSLPQYISELGEAVAIPSVSADLRQHLSDIVSMMEWAKAYVERLGGEAHLLPNPAGLGLPPLLLAEFSTDPKKHTVCCYAHLDVQPAAKEDGWATDPFVLTEDEGKLFGRGATDDKGPALSWLWAIQAYRTLNMELPVNIKLLWEGMEESGSVGIFEAIQDLSREKQFLSDVDFFCISDNYWLGASKPCLTYGLRGMAYFEVEVQCAEQDLHSGIVGGTVHEAMTDIVHLMSSLVDSAGNILVPGIEKDIAPLTLEEQLLYDAIEFDCEAYKREYKLQSVSNKLIHENKKDVLMARWRYPSLSLHGIEGAFSGPGAKTVVPAKVKGKFSVRLVPHQDPSCIEKLITDHLTSTFNKFNSPNKIKVNMLHGARPWLSDPHHPNFEAAARAIKMVYGTFPQYTREGGSIPIASALEEATKMNVCLLPVGACDDMAHGQNEKYNTSNLINGVKVLGLYLHEIGTLKGPKPSACRCIELTERELMEPGAFMRGFKCKCIM